MTQGQVSLSVHDAPIQLEGFVLEFVEQVMTGIMATLKGTEEIQNLEFSSDGEAVSINLNGTPIPVTPFVAKFISNTVNGMVSTLKGVGQIDRLEITITK